MEIKSYVYVLHILTINREIDIINIRLKRAKARLYEIGYTRTAGYKMGIKLVNTVI